MDEVERYVIEGVRAFESVESQLPDDKEIVVTEDRRSVERLCQWQDDR